MVLIKLRKVSFSSFFFFLFPFYSINKSLKLWEKSAFSISLILTNEIILNNVILNFYFPLLWFHFIFRLITSMRGYAGFKNELYETIFSISVHVSLKKSWSSCFCGMINYLMQFIVLYSFLHTQALAIIELLQEENKFNAIYGFFKINNVLLLITAYPDNNANTKSLVLMIFPFAWAFWFLFAMMRVFS